MSGARVGMTVALAAFLGLAGCASKVPVEIREPVPGSPALKEVLTDPAAFSGARVRWGGTIVEVENKQDATLIQVVGRKLESEGRPEDKDRSPGRFMAQVAGFLDPAIFAPGRQLTVMGILQDPVTREIGEYEYELPVVRARVHYLWPRKEPERRDYRPEPWVYDPWFPHHSPYYW